MGLDVYVGSLTRYLIGNWETVVQQYGRENNVPVQVIRANNPPDAITDPEEVLTSVLSWRENLSQALTASGCPALNWDERAEAPYFTDKPAWDAYGDLVLWAAYSQSPGLVRPMMSVEDWGKDPAYQCSLEKKGGSYASLILGSEIWLPVNFDFVFNADWITGNNMMFGSAFQLARELEELNANTWKAGASQLVEWRREGKEIHEPLEKGARLAFSIFSQLAQKAIENRLVMILDW
jgi:hypothetical protein